MLINAGYGRVFQNCGKYKAFWKFCEDINNDKDFIGTELYNEAQRILKLEESDIKEEMRKRGFHEKNNVFKPGDIVRLKDDERERQTWRVESFIEKQDNTGGYRPYVLLSKDKEDDFEWKVVDATDLWCQNPLNHVFDYYPYVDNRKNDEINLPMLLEFKQLIKEERTNV